MLKTLLQITRHGIRSETPPAPDSGEPAEQGRIRQEILDVLGRALAIRHVDTGSCNACELEIGAVNNPYYNLEGLGIKFVASPRHADMLLVTGPLSRHMAVALARTYDATPEPRLVVAVGDCAHDGGLFGENYATLGGIAKILPVDRVVRGCPPEPIDILRGILGAIKARR